MLLKQVISETPNLMQLAGVTDEIAYSQWLGMLRRALASPNPVHSIQTMNLHNQNTRAGDSGVTVHMELLGHLYVLYKVMPQLLNRYSWTIAEFKNEIYAHAQSLDGDELVPENIDITDAYYPSTSKSVLLWAKSLTDNK